MDVEKPVIVCIECGAAVNASWKLYCDECYRKFIRKSINMAFEDVNVRFDKGGRRWELVHGQRWVRRG